MILRTLLVGATLILASVAASAQIATTYLQAVRFLESDFNMNGVGTDPQTRKVVGQSKDGVAVIELVGDLDRLTSASLMIAVPNDSETARARNSARLLRFVANTVPEWKGNNQWIKASLRKIANGDYSDSTTTVGNKRVTMGSVKDGALILTTVARK
jgi:hypothetical protein